MAERDPKTGRFIKKTEAPIEHHPEYDELFDDLPQPPSDQDEDIMRVGVIVFVFLLFVGMIVAYLFM